MTEQLQSLLSEWESGTAESWRSDLADDISSCAEEIISNGEADSLDAELWHRFLNLTGHTDFVRRLSSREKRYAWSEAACAGVLASNYTLLSMFEHRVEKHPRRTLFQDMTSQTPAFWSYAQIADRVRAMAAVFYSCTPEPKVAILAENSVEGACTDLACLFYDILNTPVNVHFDADTLVWLFDLLDINIVVSDTEARLQMLRKIRSKTKKEFEIFSLGGSSASKEIRSLPKSCISMSKAQSEELLASRPRRPLEEVATVMFTSGSTGRPKGVVFSLFNLVSKRFARSAALPMVGDDEVLLCYLPLFHTFGRYFEMLGTVYWSGTYVFPGNPSAETLLTLLSQVNPTGLISVPIRWVQIHERCQKLMADTGSPEKKAELFRSVVGARMHWGLSAAGYLAPSIFRFFNHHGVNLCSGFGMTEATGGITMTPPGEHVDNSIGIPLPGVKARLSEQGELQIAGHYIARYLDDIPLGANIPAFPADEDEYWLPTGDLFRVLDKGHYEIVDRIKDIYKNSRGQTIAPRRCEKKLENVPGVKRSFLVGDARSYNVLLIVPDHDDPVVQGLGDGDSLREYFHQIVTTANQDLAPFERAVNFALLERDFTAEKEELTPKGSYRRKNIEANFKESIEELYQSKTVELQANGLTVKIPRWFFRDISTLEDDILVQTEGLENQSRKLVLPLRRFDEDQVLVGDLLYQLEGDVIDLGLLARQPMLWSGNPSLMEFAPCKEGWDVPLRPFSSDVRLPERSEDQVLERLPKTNGHAVRDPEFSVVNRMVITALFDDTEQSLRAVKSLAQELTDTDERMARMIRRRLQALAWHPEFKVRSAAYRTLLLDEPSPDYSRVLPAFVQSGKAFLDEESIRELASSNLRSRRLQELRQRLYTYRTKLEWPVSDVMRMQFKNMLKLLTDFAQLHPEYYNAVRSELAGWILHRTDPELVEFAEGCFNDLSAAYERLLIDQMPEFSEEDWNERLEFGDELTAAERFIVRRVLIGTGFLEESVLLAFDEELSLADVPTDGIWVSRIISRRRYLRYRVSINTSSGKHFDLQLIINEDIKDQRVLETIYWLMTISSYPYGARVLPRLGCCRLELGARSLAYLGELDVWEKVREYSSLRSARGPVPEKNLWRRLFVQALGAFFKGWLISGKRIVPGSVIPENVVVPEQDFRESATIQSLTGWAWYENTLSLVQPMLRNFYQKTHAHYSWSRNLIDPAWIFDACLEALGPDEGREFMQKLKSDLEETPLASMHDEFLASLESYLKNLAVSFQVPQPLRNAIDRYREWSRINPQATCEAREQIVLELARLYRLDRLPEVARYWMYRHTYFADASEATFAAFEKLIAKLHKTPDAKAIQSIELSELQSTIDDSFDRLVFSRLVFPKAKQPGRMDFLTVGESSQKHVILRTTFNDRLGENYVFREPIEPTEIGQLYRLFFKEGYPKTVTERDSFLVVVDAQEQLVGGLCYRDEGSGIVHLDGSVIAPIVMGRGIGSALVEDFCTRMANAGHRVVKTHFFLRRFYSKRGFNVDKRWGALVRFLRPVETEDETE